MEKHEVDHLPYRCWCEHCVTGRATGEQHHSKGEGGDIPVVAYDYLFITEKSHVLTRKEMEEAKGETVVLKVLVVKDLKSKVIFARTVPKKEIII